MKKIKIILVFVLALIMRWIYLPQAAITFGYDQGRDAFIAGQIASGDLKVLGPPVGGLPGVFHGVFYYYVVAPAYLLGSGDPVIAAFWMSFLSALGVFVIYLFSYNVTKRELPSIIAALIYAVSFEGTQYANWLSNAALGIVFVPLIYFGIWLWLRNKNKFAPMLTGIALGLSIQCNAALAYHILPVGFWLFSQRKSIRPKTFMIFLLSLIISTSTMIVSEIKFNGWGAQGLWYLFSSQDKIANSVRLGDFLLNYFNQLGGVFGMTLFPMNLVFGGIAGFGLVVWSLYSWRISKDKNLLSWQTLIASAVIGYAFALSFGGGSTPHITVGLAALISIIAGIFIWKVSEKNKILAFVFLFIILISNVVKVVAENKNGQTNFMIQKGLVLDRELAAIDYTYQKADGKPFSISTLTSPLYVNTLWSYLYNWYGLKKYGYLPYFIGNDQIGQLGNNLEKPPKDVKKHFYVMEPTYSIPQLYIDYSRGDQESISKLVERKSFGTIFVEERAIDSK